MKKKVLLTIAAAIVSASLYAGDSEPAKTDDPTPWLLGGVSVPVKPTHITPVLPMKIYRENGQEIGRELTEDEPLVLRADSSIFFDDAPATDNGVEIPNPVWVNPPTIGWRLIDWEKNKNAVCKSSEDLAFNEMLVVPTTPTKKGALTCSSGRMMKYDDVESGKPKSTYANSSIARDVVVKDITPPTCGLEISIKDGSAGTICPQENPPDHFPLPKTADVVTTGSLFNEDAETPNVVSGFVLGPDMVMSAEMAVTVSRSDVVKLSVIGDDNYKLNTAKLKYGICNGSGGEPTPICEENQPEYKLEEVNLTDNSFFYLDAVDEAGNREVLFVPIKLK